MGNHVIRWVTSEQARRYMEYDQIRPSWKHFVPHLGKVRTGICFDMLTTPNWREPSKRIGFVVDTDALPSGVQSYELDGHKVYSLTESLRSEFDKNEFKKLTQEAKANSTFYSGSPDELFVLGTISSLGSRLKGVVVLETGRDLGPACRVDLLRFTELNKIPVLRCTWDEFSDLRLAPGGFRMPEQNDVQVARGQTEKLAKMLP
jgi:hypothetical protein